MKNVIFTLAAILICTAAAFAQGSIEGTVKDPSGKPVANATIKVSDASGKLIATAVTDGEGAFSVDDVPAGTYTVSATAKGYEAAAEEGVSIEDEDSKAIDLKLKPLATTSSKPANTGPSVPPKLPLANSVTVDDVIDRYVRAMGGPEKLASIRTVKMTGTISVSGSEMEFVTTASQGIGYRMDLDAMGIANFRIVTPVKGWEFMPIQGRSAVEEMAAEESDVQSDNYDLQGPLFNHAEKGNKVELAGKEKVEGVECYRIKVTNRRGHVTHYFIDTTNYYQIRKLTNGTVNGQPIELVADYSDFKKTSNGFLFPYKVINPVGTTIYSSIVVNGPVDPAIFKPQ